MKTKLFAILLCLAFSSCDQKEAERSSKLNGKVLKDAEGNYYLVKQHMGPTFFLNELDLSGYEAF